jgi:hypothetical protein
VAVKKTAKKAPVKKAPVKKAVSKKAPVKKAVAKKAQVKKAVAKKAPVKKAVIKKAPVKKAAVKKAAKRAPAKKVAAAAVTAPFVFISSLPPVTAAEPFVAPIAVTSTPTPSHSPLATKSSSPTPKSSSRVLLWVIIGVVAIALLVVARNHKATTSTPDANPTPAMTASATTTPTDTASPAAMEPATPTPSSAATNSTTSDLAPVGIVAHYTSTGARIFWAPAAGSTGLKTYNIEAASNGGSFKLIATVPATQLSIDVTEPDTNGWTSFKISAVYSDGKIIAGKVFGLPGQYA